MNEYQSLKQEFLTELKGVGQEVSSLICDDLKLQSRRHLVYTIKGSLALAMAELELFHELSTKTNYMFVKTFDNVPYLDSLVHGVSEDEKEEMLKDIDQILESKIIRFREVQMDVDDIVTEKYLEYLLKSER